MQKNAFYFPCNKWFQIMLVINEILELILVNILLRKLSYRKLTIYINYNFANKWLEFYQNHIMYEKRKIYLVSNIYEMNIFLFYFVSLQLYFLMTCYDAFRTLEQSCKRILYIHVQFLAPKYQIFATKTLNYTRVSVSWFYMKNHFLSIWKNALKKFLKPSQYLKFSIWIENECFI